MTKQLNVMTKQMSNQGDKQMAGNRQTKSNQQRTVNRLLINLTKYFSSGEYLVFIKLTILFVVN